MNHSPIHRTCKHIGWTLAFCVILSLSGCGVSSDFPTATVNGKVSFKGAPLTTGTVNLYNKESASAAQAELDENGSFKVDGELRVGKYLVYVLPPAPPMPVMENADAPKPLTMDLGAFPDVPDKYRSQAKTDLTVEVFVGDNDLDIKIPE